MAEKGKNDVKGGGNGRERGRKGREGLHWARELLRRDSHDRQRRSVTNES